MRRSLAGLVSIVAIMSAPLVVAAQDNIRGVGTGPSSHDFPSPMGKRQWQMRQDGLKVQASSGLRNRIHRAGFRRYVELEQTRSDRIFVVIAEFGTQQMYGGTDGPLHNQIAEPNRAEDNVTIWQPDYDRAHYQDMYFNKMLSYYRLQSSGRYGFSGTVVDWVRVPYNEARYGTNLCGSIVCSSVWALVRDAITVWTNHQLDAGRTPAQIKADLDAFDVWDRYDYDGDGNFDEPDGYIDHFQIVHAGEGEETGGGAQGADAIWSHRWYAYTNLIGTAGPAFNPLGGTQFGTTGMWVGDYTMQPENGGLGVFAHEYAHDLGLPDNYDTAGGDNSTGFWDLMSVGSYLGPGREDLGARPGDMTAWDKLQLGWLNYDVSRAGRHSVHVLGPAEYNTRFAQGLLTILPEKTVITTLADPPEGNLAWYSGKGNNLDNSMIRSISLPAGTMTLTAQLWFDIELNWDYAYVSVSGDDGATWTNLAGNVTTNTNPNGQNEGNGITGTTSGFVAGSFDISAFAGQTVLLRLRYWTDGAAVQKGLLADAIEVGGFFDGAESGANGWTLDGFAASTGSESESFFHAYVSEYRQYISYDAALRTGPYNFGFLNSLPNWVEHYRYQDGLLIHYWDTSQPDNNTSEHPGAGLILPIDAHPRPLVRSDGAPWSARVQSYDSTFGWARTDRLTLHRLGVEYNYPSLPGVPFFSDTNDYWSPAAPLASVAVPKTGTNIRVLIENPFTGTMLVQVAPSR